MSTITLQLREILVIIGQYYLIPIFVVGIIGNFINVIVFSQSTLRNNGCSWYFISASVAQSFVLIFGCFMRIVISSTGFDWTASSLFFCKFRTYLFISGMLLSRHFLCLISIDRWMVTSINVQPRNLSTLLLARRMIIIGTIIWLLFDVHVLVGFHHERGNCIGNSETFYLSFFTITSLFVSLVPLTILILFMTLTLRNVMSRTFVGHGNRTVHPVAIANIRSPALQIIAERQQRHRNKHIQLIRLSLIQMFIYILLNLPSTMYALYSFITKTYDKNNDQIVIDGFINLMTSNLLYTYCAFYLSPSFV